VVCMLEGHACDALLKDSIKHTESYCLHGFFHGFVGPAFLFASGLAFGVATFKNWEQYLSWSPQLRRRLVRFIGLILIGYALHLPFFSLRKTLYDSSPQEISTFLQVDALQCIGISLLCLQILVVVLRGKKRLARITLWVSVLMILASPWVWGISFSRILPLSLVSYINAENKSWFPLFPWASYLLFGTSFAHEFVQSQRQDRTVNFMKRATVLGLALAGIGMMFSIISLDLFPVHDYWRVNPPLNIFRVGVLLIVTGVLFFLDRSYRIRFSLPIVIGRESLTIYVVHLMIIYGSVINPGLGLNWGGRLCVTELLFAFGLVSAFVFILAYSWNHLKVNFRNWALVLKLAVAATLIFSFVNRPY
jgi:uncharacterized membrane protein